MARARVLLALLALLALLSGARAAWLSMGLNLGTALVAASAATARAGLVAGDDDEEDEEDEENPPPAEDASAHANGPMPDHFYYNEVTKVSQWAKPKYEFYSEEHDRVYYQDPESGETSWEKPASLAWETKVLDDGSTVYYNTITEETTATKPIVLAWGTFAAPKQHDEL